MKGGFHDNMQVLMLGSCLMMLLLLAASYFDVNASTNDTSAVDIAKVGEVGNPFYEQHYEGTLGKPELLNQSLTGNFTGEGILNGNLNVNAEVNFERTFRDNDTAFLQGNAQLIAENGDIAEYYYNAFTNYNSDGTSQGSGAAIFNDGAIGELSFLSNTIGIYKNFVDSSGNGTFLMWQWNK
jgi:hypothetical protein